MKKIVVITVVKNESDIIESFCRYNLEYCDSILVYENNKSSDNTREILQCLIDEKLPICFEAETKDIYYEHVKDILADIAIKKYDADFVIQLDADEFLCCADSRNPREVLENLEDDIEYQVPWRTYIYENEPSFGKAFIPSGFKHYRNPALEEAQGHAGKTLASRYLLTKRKAKYCRGAHWLIYPDKFKDKVEVIVSTDLFCAHYPIRSQRQVMTKAIINYINKWTLPEFERPLKKSLNSFQLGLLFDDVKKHGKITSDTMKKVSLEYSLYTIGNRTKIKKLLSEKNETLTVKGVIDTGFCIKTPALMYKSAFVDDEGFWKSVLQITDDALYKLDAESRKKTKKIYKLEDEIKRLREVAAHCDALQVQSDDRARIIDEIYASWSWRIGHKLVQMAGFLMPWRRGR